MATLQNHSECLILEPSSQKFRSKVRMLKLELTEISHRRRSSIKGRSTARYHDDGFGFLQGERRHHEETPFRCPPCGCPFS